MIARNWLYALAFLLVCRPVSAEPQSALSLDEAVRIALDANDPTVTRFDEQAAAFGDRAVADAQLPDPQLRFNFANWPTDSFDFSQEPMTQVQMGLRQSFPRGRTLKYASEQRQAQAKAARSGGDLQKHQIILDVRQRWLQLFFWKGARLSVQQSYNAIAELLEVIQVVVSTGRQTSQDVLRAELELSLLEDRLVDIDRQTETAAADLARLVGPETASRPLPVKMPLLTAPNDYRMLRDSLVDHPSVRVEDARIEAQDKGVDIARQQYFPGFSIDAQYGLRSDQRSDFASIGVTLDVPIFTGKRQDRQVSAAKRDRQAARLDRDAQILELERRLQQTFADWRRLGERVELYQKVVVERAAETSEASINAYQSGVTDFPELIRARLAELDAELTLLQLEVQRGQAAAVLLFLEGERR